MIDRDEESLADWLFFARKKRYRRRTTHTTHTTHSSTNTEDEN